MIYRVHTTKRFNKEIEKLSKEENKRIKNIYQQIKENPYIGNQLKIKILREKRLEEKRIYYLIFEDLQAVLMIAISNKKAQQKVIDYILENSKIFRESVIK